jgi:hypothetical protein
MHACIEAAKRGDLRMLQMLRQKGVPWSVDVCEWAAEGGHLELLKSAVRNGCPWWGARTMCKAARRGDVAMQFCHESGFPLTKGVCEGAARGCQLAALAWLRERGCPWGVGTPTAAAANCDLEMLQFCAANGCRINAKSCLAALGDLPGKTARGCSPSTRTS